MKRILLCVLVYLPLLASAQNLTPAWVNAIGGSAGNDITQSTTVDASGNVYIGGSFSGTVNFNPAGSASNLTSAGGLDAFFAKYTSAGVLVWANRLGSIGDDEIYSIRVDISGNVYVAGYFSGTVDFDPGTGVSNGISNGGTDFFYAEYSSSGALFWGGIHGSTGQDAALDLKVDASGNVYVTGYFNGTVDFDPGTGVTNKTSVGGDDIFLMKVFNSGSTILSWVDTFGSTGSDKGITIDLDNSGVYLGGFYSGTIDLDPGAAIQNAGNLGGFDGLIAKYALTTGAYLLFATVRSTGDDALSTIVANGSSFYIGGYFSTTSAGFYSAPASGSIVTKSSNGGTDIFVAKYDLASLGITWLNTMGGTLDDGSDLLAIDASSNVYSAGYFQGTADFDPSTATSNLISGGAKDIYVASYGSASGTLTVAKRIGGTLDDEGTTITVDAANNVYLGGLFQGTASFDFSSSSQNKTSAGGYDGFIAKYSQTASTAPTITSFTPTSGLVGTAVTITGTNFSTIAASNTVKFNGTTAIITGTPTATSIVTSVPTGATSGPITITVGTQTGTGSTNFTVIGVPTITSFAPTSGTIGATVTITGTNFSTTAASNIVYFGATKATVSASTATQLTVVVPSGATYQPISVLVNGLIAYSNQIFIPTFLSAGIDLNSLAAKVDFTAGTSAVSVSVGDLDGDGKIDIVQPFNSSGLVVSIFRNTSISGTIAASSLAAKFDLTTGTNPLNLAIGDLDGDGKLDLASVNSGSATVSVFRNVSTSGSLTASSFAAKVDFATGATPSGIAITDLDGDGKADLAVSMSTGISVLLNITASGSINSGSFATKVDFTGITNPFGIVAGDIDGDGKSDLVLGNGSVVSIFRNTSTVGAITSSSLAAKVDFTVAASPESIALGDLDGDGKIELVAVNNAGNTISVFRNTSASGSITLSSFSAKVDFTTGTAPRAVAISDIDGDAKSDLVSTNTASNSVSILRNTSTSGSITAASFATKVDFVTGTGPLGLAVGDIDGDGKPDLTVSNSTAGTISILRNQITTVVLPTITSFTPTSGASGTTVTITGTNFSTTAANNTVKFNGTVATVTGTPTATSITATVPSGATTGTISITVSGQVGTSTSSFTVLSLQPSNLLFTLVTSTSLTASFTAPLTVPTGYIAFRKVGSVSTTGVPVNGTPYTTGSTVGDGEVVYSGTALTFNNTGLTPGTQYFYSVYSYNGSGTTITYITTGPLIGSQALPLSGSLAAEPTAQPTNLVFSAVSTTAYTGTFVAAAGVPDGYLVISNAGSIPTGVPIDAVTYTAGQSLPNGTGTVLSSGSSTTFTATALSAGTPVFVTIYSFKGASSSLNYYTLNPLIGNVTTLSGSTLATEPTAQATALTFASVTTSSFTVSFTAATGAPAGYIVLRKIGSAPSVGVPLDGTTYVTGALIGDGTVAFIGSGTTFSETNLLSVTTYFYNVYSYNGTSTSINYFVTTPLAGSQQTISITPTIASFLPTSGPAGTSVVVTGTNFSTTAASNTLKFNGTTATITGTPTATSITATVPTGATTGTISVTVGTLTATSTTSFTVVPLLTIAETFITTYLKDGTSKVSITVNDPSQVGSVKFWTKGITVKNVYTSRTVTGTAGKFEAIFSASELTDPIGLNYYFEVIDNLTKSLKSSTGLAYPTLTGSSSDQIIPGLNFGSQISNYQIIAVPTVLTDKAVLSVFNELAPYNKSKWRLFTYNNNAYSEFASFSTIDPGRGYFFIATTSTSISVGAGTPVQVSESSPFTISLTPGWNLIGNPYNFRVLWQDVLDLNTPATGVGKLRVFSNGALTDATTLEKFRGAFVNSTASVTLKIPVIKTQSGRIADTLEVPADLNQPQWSFELVLNDGTLSNHLGGIGMHPQAKLTGIDDFDEVSFPIPESFGMMSVVFRHPELKETLDKEIVPTAPSHTWDFDVVHSKGNGPLVIQWKNDFVSAGDKKLVLFDPTALVTIDMKHVNQYQLTPQSSKLRILYGSAAYVNEALDKELPFLGVVYPNPAQQNLSVPFRVPLSMESASVNISVYDSQGKVISTLVDGQYQKGSYERVWIPEVGPGLYYIQLRLGTHPPQAQKVIIR